MENSDQERRVFVGNLPYEVKWQDLKDFMRQAGEVVHADVLLTGKGQSRGCGIVEYSKPEEARNAVDTLNNQTLQGRPIFVREDREAASAPSRAAHTKGAVQNAVFVGNLPFQVSWQDLKDLFREAGKVVRADVHTMYGGRSRGHGTVAFETPEEVQIAIQKFNNYELQGRVIDVREDKPFNERQHNNHGQAQMRTPQQGWSQHQGVPMAVDQAQFAPVQQLPVAVIETGNGEPSATIHIGNLPYNTTDEDLFKLSETVGPVIRAHVHVIPGVQNLGTGVVEYASLEYAGIAIAQLNGYNYGKRDIVVTYARIPPGVQQ